MNDNALRTKDDLQKQLDEQLSFLRTSADLYDSGSEIEAKRMAATLRILLHDTSHSTSLLSSLELKDIDFVDSSHEDISNSSMTYCGLVSQTLGLSRPRYVALLDKAPSILRSFSQWWDYIILKDMDGNMFSRKDLVLTIANKDGGAHIDPKVPLSYTRLQRGESTGHMWSYDGQCWERMEGAELATIRQIAHEVLKTLEPTYQRKLALPPGTITFSGIQLVYSDGTTTSGNTISARKVGRNNPCPCGSGKKYKKCHGA